MAELKKTLQSVYLEYLNDFLTVNKFAEYYDISTSMAKQIIDIGRKVHEDKVEMEKRNIHR